MQPHDIDWEKIADDWDENGIQSVICRLSVIRDKKRSARIHRKTIIRKEEP